MVLRYWAGRLALALALAVLISGGGSPAHALVKPPLIDPAGSGFLVKAGQGVSKFGKLVPGPVGGILTAGSLAWWAYSELKGEVNAPQTGGTVEDYLGPPEADYPSANEDAAIEFAVTTVSGRNVSIEITCKATTFTSGQYYCNTPSGIMATVQVGAASTNTTQPTVRDYQCRNTTTNVVRSGTFSTSPWSHSFGWNNPQVKTATICNSGEVVHGFRISGDGVRCGSCGWLQQANIGWGSLAGGEVFPPGEMTFQTAVIDATCKNATTGATQHIYATSDWGTAGQLTLPSCKEELGSDWYGTGVKVIPMDPEIDDVPLDPEIWPDWDVPDFMPEEWQEDEATPEEEAMPCYGTKKGCGLSINIDGEPVYPGTTTRTKIDTLTTNDPDRVTCKWGTVTVDWKYCIPLLPTYEPGSGGQTTTDPTKPDTGTGTPTTGTGTQPVPTEATSCIKAAFSWNPVDWVFVPVKCALQWAFKPTTAFETRIARIKTAFESKPPFSWLLTLDDLPPVAGAGCPTSWVWNQAGESYPILCGTAMGDGLHAFRPVMVVLLVGAAVYPFLRALVYAAFPIVKPVPHD